MIIQETINPPTVAYAFISIVKFSHLFKNSNVKQRSTYFTALLSPFTMHISILLPNFPDQSPEPHSAFQASMNGGGVIPTSISKNYTKNMGKWSVSRRMHSLSLGHKRGKVKLKYITQATTNTFSRYICLSSGEGPNP